MKFKHLLTINLHMFEGGSAAAGSAGGTGATATGNGSATGDTNGAVPGSTRRGKKSGEFSNVLFGKQTGGTTVTATVTNAREQQSHAAGDDNNQGVQNTSDALEARRRAFRELVTGEGEFKDIYAEEVQRVINRRFSESRTLENQVQAQKPVIDLLMQRYNISDGDMSKLMSAIENDNAYWSEAAEAAGMSVEQYKEFQKMKRENAALLAAERGRQQKNQQQEQAQKWYQESLDVKSKFPGFDLKAELQNPAFVSMLRSGTPMEHAYKVMHFDELMQGAVQLTTASTEKRVVNNVRARGNRPAENGTASQGAFIVRDDVSKLSKRERAEIARQTMRGERFEF